METKERSTSRPHSAATTEMTVILETELGLGRVKVQTTKNRRILFVKAIMSLIHTHTDIARRNSFSLYRLYPCGLSLTYISGKTVCLQIPTPTSHFTEENVLNKKKRISKCHTDKQAKMRFFRKMLIKSKSCFLELIIVRFLI